jgi:hypothetical protein
MKLTFGIVTNGKSEKNLRKSISSIRDLEVPDYEIIVVGNTKIESATDLTIIPFNESEKPNWITRKKNIISQKAKSEFVVFLHDYVVFSKDWYQEFKKIEKYDVAICEVLNFDGTRFRDWVLWVENNSPFDKYLQRTRKCLLPYNVRDLTPYMYISGTFWVARKDFMLDNPLDEDLTWGEMEDIEWSKRIRRKTIFKFAPGAKVKLLKLKDVEYIDADPHLIEALIQYLKSGTIDVSHQIIDEFQDLRLVPTSKKINLRLQENKAVRYLLSNILKIIKHP